MYQVNHEFAAEVQQTISLLANSASTINNAIRQIEREHPHADEEILASALHKISTVAGDLSEQWEDLKFVSDLQLEQDTSTPVVKTYSAEDYMLATEHLTNLLKIATQIEGPLKNAILTKTNAVLDILMYRD